ncbi:MAG: hypothetical protein IPP74_01355 [Alphaproteobacteria bacterium]|nr:hypothetical protein [Alphaproteobacteria bacterium]
MTWQSPSHTFIAESNDLDTLIALELSKSSDRTYRIIDVSELSSADLLTKQDGYYDNEQQRFIFKETPGALLEALDNNENIILKGKFSPELCDSLAPLLMDRYNNPYLQNQLKLISDGPSYLRYMFFYGANIVPDNKLMALHEQGATIEIIQKLISQLAPEQLASEPLSKLQARLRYLQLHPEGHSDNAWIGVYSLPQELGVKPYDLQNSEAITSSFTQNRLQQVNEVLAHSPFVLLTGHTGVGKTTFVQEALFSKGQAGLHQGLAKLSDWAKDKTAGRKVLFIDEANITAKNWSVFEGLFNNPPSIVIDGQYLELTTEHKVVFAANPLSYGSARTLPTLFQRHGNAVLFEPMPVEMIYETQLKPLFKGTKLASQLQELAKIYLDVYQTVCGYSKSEILLSPREIQQMALLTLAYCKRRGDKADPILAATHYAYQVAYQHVPRNQSVKFNDEYKPQRRLPRARIKGLPDDYIMTSSRRPVMYLLNDIVNLRSFKRANPGQVSCAGLGGVILEGKPGVGKKRNGDWFVAVQGLSQRSRLFHDTREYAAERKTHLTTKSLP